MVHPVPGGRVDQRSVRNIGREWVTNRKSASSLGQESGVIANQWGRHEMPAGCHAHLTRVHERANRSGDGRLLHVRVFQHYQCGVPTELEMHPFE